MKKYNLHPEFEIETKGFCNIVTKIDNDYLQAWADAGAYVMSQNQDWWIMTDAGQLWLKIKEDKIHLECIAVSPDERRKGNGRKLMGYLTELADETNTIVSLEVSTVGSNGMMITHPVVGLGSSKKNKIPVKSLPKWYGSMGFEKTETYTEKKRKMIRLPKNK